jgi:hypothetical protein
MSVSIFEDIKKTDNDPLDVYLARSIRLLLNHNNDDIRKGISSMNFSIFKENRVLATVFTFGMMNKQKELQSRLKKDIKTSLKLKSKKFKSKRFFKRLNNICESYLMSHENDETFVKDLQIAYDMCKK